MACAGDVPTLETLAAVELLRSTPGTENPRGQRGRPDGLQPPTEHPHGHERPAFRHLFTKDKPIVFAYHGYPWLIHRLTYRRTNHGNLHARLQGRGDHEHGVRYDGAQRSGPVSPGRRRGRPRAELGGTRRGLKKASATSSSSTELHRAVWRGHAGDPRLEVDVRCQL